MVGRLPDDRRMLAFPVRVTGSTRLGLYGERRCEHEEDRPQDQQALEPDVRPGRDHRYVPPRGQRPTFRCRRVGWATDPDAEQTCGAQRVRVTAPMPDWHLAESRRSRCTRIAVGSQPGIPRRQRDRCDDATPRPSLFRLVSIDTGTRVAGPESLAPTGPVQSGRPSRGDRRWTARSDASGPLSGPPFSSSPCRRPRPRLWRAHRAERGGQPAPDHDPRGLPRRGRALRHGLPVRRWRRRLRVADATPGHPLERREGRRLDAPASRPRDRPGRLRGDVALRAAAPARRIRRGAHEGPHRRARRHRPARRRRPRSASGRRTTASASRPTRPRSSTSTPQRTPDLPRRGVRRRRGRGARPGDRRRHAGPRHDPDRQPVGPAPDPRPRQDGGRARRCRRLPADRPHARRSCRPRPATTACASTTAPRRPSRSSTTSGRDRAWSGCRRRGWLTKIASTPRRPQLSYDLAIDAVGCRRAVAGPGRARPCRARSATPDRTGPRSSRSSSGWRSRSAAIGGLVLVAPAAAAAVDGLSVDRDADDRDIAGRGASPWSAGSRSSLGLAGIAAAWAQRAGLGPAPRPRSAIHYSHFDAVADHGPRRPADHDRAAQRRPDRPRVDRRRRRGPRAPPDRHGAGPRVAPDRGVDPGRRDA